MSVVVISAASTAALAASTAALAASLAARSRENHTETAQVVQTVPAAKPDAPNEFHGGIIWGGMVVIVVLLVVVFKIKRG